RRSRDLTHTIAYSRGLGARANRQAHALCIAPSCEPAHRHKCGFKELGLTLPAHGRHIGDTDVSGICRGCADQAPCSQPTPAGGETSGISGVLSIPDLIIWALFGGCCALPRLAAVSVGRLRLKPR